MNIECETVSNIVAHKPNILNVIYTNPPSDQFRVQLSSLRFFSIPEPNKPNQIFLQALNKVHVLQREKHSMVNECFKLFYVFICMFFNFVHLSEVLSNRQRYTYPSHISHLSLSYSCLYTLIVSLNI